MIDLVYVLDEKGDPLMPTKRFAKVRKMLKENKAKIVNYKPFTIQLLYEPVTHIVQPLYMGVDPGRTNIGISVVNDNGKIFYASETVTRNEEIPKLMKERKIHRQARRRGERLVKKRRAFKNGTTKDFPNGRKLPGYKKGVLGVKDIINSEAKFNNRKPHTRHSRLTPTVRHLILTHTNLVERIHKILPIFHVTFEMNKFAFMKLDNNTIMGVDYQNGRMKNFKSVEEYISNIQHGKCICCNNKIDLFHHLIPQHEEGSNLPQNIVGICTECHAKVHTGKLSLKQIGEKKKYAALSILNQACPHIYKTLIEKYGDSHISICSGYETSIARGDQFKTHWIDAAYIGSFKYGIMPLINDIEPFKIIQYRNHNRALIHHCTERKYCINKKEVARNRNRRFEQKEISLKEWHKKQIDTHGEKYARKLMSKLTVKPSLRYYNNPKRLMPGTLFKFEDNVYILTSILTKGKYFHAYNMGDKNFPANKCKIVSKVKSLVYMQ